MDRREVNHKWYSSFSEDKMCFIIEEVTDAEGNPYDMEIPAIFGVCDTCDGKGKHVNPSIDSNGLSREDFDNDPDFEEDYFNGFYDVDCNECHGKRVSPEVAWDKLSKENERFVREHIQSHYDYQAECDMERRMGC